MESALLRPQNAGKSNCSSPRPASANGRGRAAPTDFKARFVDSPPGGPVRPSGTGRRVKPPVAVIAPAEPGAPDHVRGREFRRARLQIPKTPYKTATCREPTQP